MADSNLEKTSGRKLLRGAIDGKPFTSENQPTPEAKSKGWQELRAQKLLTQNMLKLLLDKEGIPTKDGEDFFKSLIINAKSGNPKAIDVIINTIEEQKIVTENKHTIDIETVTFK